MGVGSVEKESVREPADVAGPGAATALAQQTIQLEVSLRESQRRLETLASHLSLAFLLPRFFSESPDVLSALGPLCKALTRGLHVQKVQIFSLEERGLSSLAGVRVPFCVPIPAPMRDLLMGLPSGFCNDSSDARFAALATSVGLSRFVWAKANLGRLAPSALVVAGFDAERAPFQAEFGPADAASLENLSHQVGTHADNAELLRQLSREKADLQELRLSLEQRVREKTSALVDSNQALSRALEEVKARTQHIEADLAEAERFQRSVLAGLPSHPRLSTAAHYRPLDKVGGDFYNVASIGPGMVRCFLADATGHGVQAALRTTIIASEYARLRHSSPRPNVMLRDLDRKLSNLFPGGDLLTAAACFDLDLRRPKPLVRVGDAGTPPLVHLSRRGVTEVLANGTLLGAGTNGEFGLTEFEMEPGDALLLFSDGLVDAANERGEPFAFTEANFAEFHSDLVRAIENTASADNLMNLVLDRLGAFSAGQPLGDDLTVLCLRVE